MALTKEVVIDQITVLEDGQMQVREVTRIMEDGVELSKSYHRHVVSPGDDLTKEDAKVAEVGTVVHTEQVKMTLRRSRKLRMNSLKTWQNRALMSNQCRKQRKTLKKLAKKLLKKLAKK
jgi:hypothetical protein